MLIRRLSLATTLVAMAAPAAAEAIASSPRTVLAQYVDGSTAGGDATVRQRASDNRRRSAAEADANGASESDSRPGRPRDGERARERNRGGENRAERGARDAKTPPGYERNRFGGNNARDERRLDDRRRNAVTEQPAPAATTDSAVTPKVQQRVEPAPRGDTVRDGTAQRGFERDFDRSPDRGETRRDGGRTSGQRNEILTQQKTAPPAVQPSAPMPAPVVRTQLRDESPDRRRRADRQGGPRNIEDLRKGRRERRDAKTNRTIIEEPGQRVIVRQGDRIVIQQNETERLQRVAPRARTERGKNNRTLTVVERPGNVNIISETDQSGRLLRRYRRDASGRETIIIDNRKRRDSRRDSTGRNLAIGAGIGVGVVAGALLLDSMINVPPPRVRIPRDRYIVDYSRASDDDVYDALSAPPVDRYEDRYTLDEIRATHHLRQRMRRVDLDDVTFAFGSWQVDPSEYRRLERVARAMRRVISRNPDEVFLVEGHTDAVGSRIDNLTLSDRRAEEVVAILVEEFDVPFENLVAQGYGEDYLKINTQAPERLNRRVAIRRITPLLDRDDRVSRYSEDEDDYRRDRR